MTEIMEKLVLENKNNRVHTGKFEQNSRTSQDYPTVFKD